MNVVVAALVWQQTRASLLSLTISLKREDRRKTRSKGRIYRGCVEKQSALEGLLQNLVQTTAEPGHSSAPPPPEHARSHDQKHVSGFSLRDLNTQNKSAQLLLCEAAANGFSFLAGESAATLNMNKLALMKQLGNGLVRRWF